MKTCYKNNELKNIFITKKDLNNLIIMIIIRKWQTKIGKITVKSNL